MSLRALKREAAGLLERLVSQRNIGDVQYSLSEPPSTDFGELTCNIAFLLAQRLHRKPNEVAKEVVESLTEYLNQQKESGSLLEQIEAHPSGHINFRAKWNVVSKTVMEDILTNNDYGRFNFGNQKRIIIEHTSVNPNKALHVGHMRNMIIGDVLYRIFSGTNHDTSVLYYVDDSGPQVADILVGFLYAGFSIDPPDPSMKFDQYCGDNVYVKINEMYASNPDLQEKRRSVMMNIEEGTSDLSRFAKEISIRVLRDQLKTCWSLKVRYDLLNFESDMIASKLWDKMFGILKHKGIARYQNKGKNKGCWIIKGTGIEDDKVLVRSDGTLTYIAKDIPYAAWKLGLFSDPFFYYPFSEQWDGSILWADTLDKSIGFAPQRPFGGAETIINLIDSRQARLQEIISSTLSAINGYDMKRYIHLSYEPVTLSHGTARSLGINTEDSSPQMSGRKGIYIRADQIMEIVCQKAKEEIQTRNRDMGEDELEKISRSLGRSAVRYNLIKQDLDRIIVFDLNESLSLDGDSGPYLQYAYARAQRLLEKGKTRTHFDPRLLVHEREVNLIRGLSKMDMVIEECALQMNPKILAKYAHNLAVAFNIFYEQVPILKGENEALVAARLSLVKAFSSVMSALLNYLGIDPLSRM